jgi:tetratricopeptide (TPR) repeat protein
MYTRFAQDWLANQPGLQPAQRGLLIEALGFYQEFAREEGGDALAWNDVGQASLRVSEIQHALGETHAAEQAGKRALEVFESLLRKDPTRADYRRNLAEAEMKLGRLAAHLGRIKEGEGAFHRAASLRRALLQEQPDSIEDRFALATTLVVLANQAALEEALAILNELLAQNPLRPDFLLDAANAHGHLGSFLYDRGDVTASESHHREAMRISRALDRQFPDQYQYQRRLLISLADLGRDLGSQGRYAEEEPLAKEAIGISRRLAQEFPAVIATQMNLAVSSFNLGNVLLNLGPRYGEAQTHYLESIALAQRMIAEHPQILPFQKYLVEFRLGLAELREKMGRHREALRIYQEALLELERLELNMVNAAENLRYRAQVNQTMARLLATTCDPQLRDTTRAVSLATKAAELSPKEAAIWNTLGMVRYRAGEWREAIAALEKAMELRSGGDANDWLLLAMAHWQRGDRDAARRWYDRGLGWMKENARRLSGPEAEMLRRVREDAEVLLGCDRSTNDRTQEKIPPDHRSRERSARR